MPYKLAEHHARGTAAALERFGFRQAAEEVRLKIPTRTFHGLEAAHKAVAARGAKKANEEMDADTLADLFEQLPVPPTPGDATTAKDPMDRTTAWGAPSSLSGGNTSAGDMGQPTDYGGV